MKVYSVSSSFLISTLLASAMACTQPTNGDSEAATAISAALGQDDGNLLWVAKAQLGKEFLLQGNLVAQDLAPMGGGLRSRVVTFEKRDDKLFMMEATEGHTVAPEIPADLILASFPIRREDEQRIVFDFNEGMTKIFAAADWASQDSDGAAYASSFESAHIGLSYVRSTKADNVKNQFVIDQVAQVDISTPNGTADNSTYAVKYYLTPYAKNPSYAPYASPGIGHVGFFEVTPTLKPGGGVPNIYATRFAPNKRIKFAISNNTPAEFRDAVRDGIQYWNQVLGAAARIEVTVAEPSATAPDFDENIVQWIPYEDAGFAYADAQMDPRTGETLHGQVWLTSSWAVYGRDDAQRLARKFADIQPTSSKRIAGKGAKALGLAGMMHPALCSLGDGMNLALAQRMQRLLQTDATDATILKASQDTIRTVVAHEVGHVLGLRHNFAGSVNASYPFEQEEELVAEYIRHGASSPRNVIATSSLMDYNTSGADMLTGDRIEKKGGILPYDGAAIGILYNGVKIKNETIPTFCTDSQVDEFVDCAPFDGGRSPAESALVSRNDTVSNLATNILETYIEKMTGQYGTSAPVKADAIVLNPVRAARSAYAPYFGLYQQFTDAASSVRVRQALPTFPVFGPLEQSNVAAAESKFLASEVNRMGGMDALFALPKESDAAAAYTKLVSLLDDPRYLAGKGWNGQPFKLTRHDVAVIKANSKKYFAAVTEQFMHWHMAALSGQSLLAAMGSPFAEPSTQLVVDGPLSDALAAATVNVANEVLFAKTGSFVTGDITLTTAGPGPNDVPKSEVKHVKLPVWKYSNALRTEAFALVRTGAGTKRAYMLAQTEAIHAAFAQNVDDLFGTDLDTLSAAAATFPNAIAEWVLNERAVSDGSN
jgi:hypothetical protein